MRERDDRERNLKKRPLFSRNTLTEIAIVGGGPVGFRVAQKTASAGYKTTVLENKSAIGKPVQCAGIVSPRVISMTGTEHVMDRPEEAVINSPFGKQLVLENEPEKAVIIDRADFDKELAEKAIKAGANIELGSAVKKVEHGKNRKLHIEKRGEKKTIEPKIIVGADGPSSIVRESGDFPSPEELLPAVQAVVASKDRSVKIHLGDEIASDFFLWEVPYRSGKVVGLAGSRDVYRSLMRFLKSKELEDKVISFLSGTIPLGNMTKSVDEGVMLVGDAACQVKPMSGGGLYYGLKAADICSNVVIDALEEEDVSKERLNEYHEEWQREIGKHISKGMRARNIFKSLSDKDLDKLIESLSKDKTRRVIEENGDIDNPSALVKPLLKVSPDLLKFTGPVIKSLF